MPGLMHHRATSSSISIFVTLSFSVGIFLIIFQSEYTEEPITLPLNRHPWQDQQSLETQVPPAPIGRSGQWFVSHLNCLNL